MASRPYCVNRLTFQKTQLPKLPKELSGFFSHSITLPQSPKCGRCIMRCQLPGGAWSWLLPQNAGGLVIAYQENPATCSLLTKCPLEPDCLPRSFRLNPNSLAVEWEVWAAQGPVCSLERLHRLSDPTKETSFPLLICGHAHQLQVMWMDRQTDRQGAGTVPPEHGPILKVPQDQ